MIEVMLRDDGLHEQLEITKEMKKRLCDVLCVAPWTELDLRCEK